MQSHLITIGLALTISISTATTGFAEPPHDVDAAPAAEVMSFSMGDTIYIDQGHSASCAAPAEDGLLAGSIAGLATVVTEYEFPVDELVLDAPAT